MTKIINLVLRRATQTSTPTDKIPAPVALSPQQLGMVGGGAPAGTWKQL